MGLYDRLVFEDGLDISFPELPVDPRQVTWQTKTVERPTFATYKVTHSRRLYREDVECTLVPEEERPRYDASIEGFEREFDRAFGMFRTIHKGWTDCDYHGVIEVHRSIEDELVRLDLIFTHGELEMVRRLE